MVSLYVLFINSDDYQKSVSSAVFRLHDGFKKFVVSSKVLMRKVGENSQDVVSPRSKLAKVLSLIRPTLENVPLQFYPDRYSGVFSAAWVPSRLNSKIESINPDVVHVHWIRNLARIEEISKINKPIVWTLHDMWAFTGG